MQNIIQKNLPNILENQYNVNFSDLPIDSIDLVSLRVDLENHIGKTIPNKDWLAFKNLNDILHYTNDFRIKQSSDELLSVQSAIPQKKNYITMPQMCLEGLSENWLFKEAGDLHWELLCNGLNTPSSELQDELGNRLYATFVRIRLSASHNLGNFQENSPYEFSAELSRYGMGMYFSDQKFISEEKEIKLELMTSFSVRKSVTDNKTLVKSQPYVEQCSIRQLKEFPNFGNEYRLIKKKELSVFFYKDEVFHIKQDEIYNTIYTLNPYYDLNGVGLLYFAAYPIINDYCLLEYMRKEKVERFEEEYYTIFRDISYYANCNADDQIIFQLNSIEDLKDGKKKIQTTLFRKSDNKMMALIFTIKQKKI